MSKTLPKQTDPATCEPISASLPQRIAVLLTVIVFPLIWAGELVEPWGAGMTVPLLASISVLVAIALVWFTFKHEHRRWVGMYSVGLFLLTLFQGLLGRVRTMAKIHDCVWAVAFLAVVGFCVVTSRWWFDQESFRRQGSFSRSFTSNWPTLMLVVAYCQFVVGAFLRHISAAAPPSQYKMLVVLHVLVAVSLVAGTFVQAIAVWRAGRYEVASKGLVGSIRFLILAIVAQFCLGVGTWVVKFGWPAMFDDQQFAAAFVVPEKSLFQMNLITAHVAVGSLILAFWTVQTFRAHRLFAPALLGSSGDLCHVKK